MRVWIRFHGQALWHLRESDPFSRRWETACGKSELRCNCDSDPEGVPQGEPICAVCLRLYEHGKRLVKALATPAEGVADA